MNKQIKKETLEFTVDFPALAKELAMFITTPAGLGGVYGLKIALMRLDKIAKLAMEHKDAQILMQCYALGLISSPVAWLKEKNLWTDELEKEAHRIGAQ